MPIGIFIFWLLLQLSAATTDVSSCTCGFRDPRTGAVWTDAIITYANETDRLPANSLIAENFQHSYEKNWNALYRAGASAANLGYNESTSPGWTGNAWTLNLEKPSQDHAVVGASIRSLRRDILYGSFEAALGAPESGVGGSVLDLRLDYNESQTLNINVMNADNPKHAWTSLMMEGDWRGDRSKGVNFSDFGNSTYEFASSPWGFVPYRIEWSDKQAEFFIGDALARSVSTRNVSQGWPTTPSTLYMRHLSIGDKYTSQGPPPNGSQAKVGMLRAFFNSSLMSVDDHVAFDNQCQGSGQVQCLVTDTLLRGSSPFTEAAVVPFKEPSINYKKRWPAIFIACICITISSVLLAHALIKRAPWKPKKSVAGSVDAPSTASSNTLTPSAFPSAVPSVIFSEDFGLTHAAQSLGTCTPGAVTPGFTTPHGGCYTPSVTSYAQASMLSLVGAPGPVPSAPYGQRENKELNFRESLEVTPVSETTLSHAFLELAGEKKSSQVIVQEMETDSKGSLAKLPETTVKQIGLPEGANTVRAEPHARIGAPAVRVNYLAGLVALAAVLVSLTHFCLTFLPATQIPFASAHYESELWAFKIITPYIMGFSWIGPFLTTSTRFLVMTYIKTGNLQKVAEKVVGRTPRLIIPCAAFAALEYFCMQMGAVTWLEYLPSVTWSTWPYTTSYTTFGHFISEVIELMYIIPNAAPQITFNYCIGVFWTIPVQLQNSWLALLGVIVIREIKTPWKRMGYYAFCVLMHWYATSWGSFFWMGLLIADLDITYKWKPWLYARPWAYYPFITFLTILTIGSQSLDLVGQWTPINFNTREYGIHPDHLTGQPIRDTTRYGFPPYYVPALTTFTFSIGIHLLVELSPLMQKFFTNRVFMWLFPHIMTLYLIHGLIFWSLGSVICIKLAALGVPYWANMLVTATCSFTVTFGCLPFLTPIIETLGKSVTLNIWRDASEKPAKRRKSLYPFGADMFMGGEKNDAEAEVKSGDVENIWCKGEQKNVVN